MDFLSTAQSENADEVSSIDHCHFKRTVILGNQVNRFEIPELKAVSGTRKIHSMKL